MDAVEHSGAPTGEPSGGRAPALARAACCGRCGWRPRCGRVALQRSGRRRPGASGGARARRCSSWTASTCCSAWARATTRCCAAPPTSARRRARPRRGAPPRPPALRGGDRAASRACRARAPRRAAGRVWKQDRQPCGMLAGMLLPARPLQRAAAPRMRRHASGALARTRQAAGRAGSLPRVTAGGGGAACARAAPSRARLRRSAIALGG